MNDTMIQTQGGPYTPEELASAYAERGERIETLLRDKAFFEERNTELEAVAEAVMTLMNFATKGEDLRDLRSDLNDLRCDLDDLRSDFDDFRSDDERIDETSSTLKGVVRALRDAAAELASV